MKKKLMYILMVLVLVTCSSVEEQGMEKPGNEQSGSSKEKKSDAELLGLLKNDFNKITQKMDADTNSDVEKNIKVNGILVSIFYHRTEKIINENVQARNPKINSLLNLAVEMKELTDAREVVKEFTKKRSMIQSLIDECVASVK
jgi:DNA phosphorothioation-dependent restriction protein DptG